MRRASKGVFVSDSATAAPTEQPSWLTVILAKFRDLLREKVDPADFDGAWLSARGHGGGKASAAAKAKSKSASDLAACDLRPWSFAEGDHPGLFIGLFLDPASAAALAIDGGEPADALHITLCYEDALEPDELMLARIVARIADSCSWRSPLVGSVSGWGRFAGDDGQDVFVALPDVPGLADLYSAVKSTITDVLMAYPEMRGEHDFVPHVTLAYIPSSDPNPVEAIPDAALRFDALTIVYGGRTIAVPFKGGYAYGEFAVAEGSHGARLFTEVQFAEPPSRVAILPKPGTYAHAQYGSVDMTAERVDRFVANHNDNIYGQKLPIQIDAGHDLESLRCDGMAGEGAGRIGWQCDRRG